MRDLNKFGIKVTVDVSHLNLRQQAFVREYLIDANATKAAIRAGYSKKGAHVVGSRLLSSPAISELLTPHALSTETTKSVVNRWKNEVEKYAYADISVKKMDHHVKVKYLDMVARAENAYQDASGVGGTNFQINIHIGSED